MPQTALIQVRVDRDLKNEMDELFNSLGLDTSTAIRMFLKQVERRRGLPFDVTLPSKTPLEYESLSCEQFDAELDEGLADLNAGRVMSSSQVRENMQRKYKK
jgi:addiction module RelB/DinJ family antitoxin